MLLWNNFKSINQGVWKIIKEEQDAQYCNFIPSMDYLKKISEHAELITHQKGNHTFGFVYFYCNSEEKDFSYITLIATSREIRNQGVGGALINQVLFITQQRGFKECRLEVRKKNISAFDFYLKIGFEIFEDRGDRFLMRKSIVFNKEIVE